MRTYRFWNNLTGWLVWVIATLVFVGTAERSASWWDCGEYISTASKLMVGHPPGAPTFQLLGCIFGIFAFGDPSKIGFMVNVMSALCSSFTILFLFWSITLLAKKLVYQFSFSVKNPSGKGRILDTKAPDFNSWIPDWTQMLLIFGSGVIGALAYTFSDSFWFSAVEGEVYAMSSFFTAVTFWAILKWEAVADSPHNLRWLIFIAFLIGLAIGVHLLNLLVIPAVAFVVYYKKFKSTRKGQWLTLILSFVLLAFVLWGIVPMVVKLAGKFELFFVNSLKLPFNVGTIFFFVLLIAALVFGLIYAYRKQHVVLHTSLLCLCFLLIGYSTFITLVIRANANVPLNQGEVKTAISLLSYLNRDQYGSNPLIYGQYYNAPLIAVEPANPQYIRNDSTGRYESAGFSSQKLTYDPEYCGLFPRIHSSMESGGRPCQTYNKIWSGCDDQGRPSMGENIRFLVRYQLGWMYVRYFMWNFVGRQNDIMGRGYNPDGSEDVLHGNWLSGIKFIDEARLGPQDNLPRELAENPARNTFFFLPLLLGLIGLYFHWKYAPKDTFVVFLLFFMTGLAIVLYLNQPSTEPRERDYAVVGSFYAFAIWIGLGFMGLCQAFRKFLVSRDSRIKGVVYGATFLICLFAVPVLMAQQGWDDHDRSERTSARDFGKNMMESCEPNAIIISDGDNDTYPMWFCQHVEEVRHDIRLVNSILANSSWLIQPLYREVYQSAPFKFSLDAKNYGGGKNEVVMIQEQISKPVELESLLEFVNMDNPATKLVDRSGEKYSFFPARNVQKTLDKELMRNSGLYSEDEIARTPDKINWKIGKNQLTKSDLVLLDIVANNWETRPIYFVSPYGHRDFLPSLGYSQIEGMVFRFVPFKNENSGVLDSRTNGMNSDRTFDLLVNKFEWGNINKEGVKLDPETRSWSEQARHQYATLGMVLFSEGKLEMAEQALDKGLYYFPDASLPFNQNTLIYAQVYYLLNSKEKAESVLNILTDEYSRWVDYYSSFPSKYYRGVQSELQEAINVLGSVKYLASQYGSEDLVQRVDKVFKAYRVDG